MSYRITYAWRLYFLIFLLLLIVAGLLWRIIYLGTARRGFLEKQSAVRSLRVINIPAHRGMILDRNGTPLAISTPVAAIWVSPVLFKATPEQTAQLAKILNLNVAYLSQKIAREKQAKREFLYLKRHLPPQEAQAVKNLKITGVFSQQEYQRYYPEGEVTSQLLGFTNIDDRGMEGLELAYNRWLRGMSGRKEVTKDRLGHIVNELKVIKPPQAGHNLVLSIDHNIQYLAYKELQNTVTKYHAEAGSAVVLDAQTGEVLAMVNQPSYNPNAPHKAHNNALRNRAVTDEFEPGSIMKAFSIASALASGKYHPNTKIDTNPGWLNIEGNTVTDEGINRGVLTVSQVLQKSSNIGVAKMTLSLPANHLSNLLQRFGFGESTYSGFPGEAMGSLPSYLKWRPFVLATLAFGYAIAVTPLQLTRAYAVLADGGILRPVTFLKINVPLQGQRVLSAHVAKQMLAMLATVLKVGGTGTRAQVAGYRVAGKTGTANIAEHGHYVKNKYYASFVGIAPLHNPRLVVAVIVRNPQGQHYGGLVAAPAFANIMAGALRILNVHPDQMTDSEGKGQ